MLSWRYLEFLYACPKRKPAASFRNLTKLEKPCIAFLYAKEMPASALGDHTKLENDLTCLLGQNKTPVESCGGLTAIIIRYILQGTLRGQRLVLIQIARLSVS